MDMPFRAWIVVVALVVVTTYAAVGLLDGEPVPIAPSVELSGTAIQPRPPSDGFFIVPPQVVDFSDSGDVSQPADDSPEENDVTQPVTDSVDDSPDDSPDDDGGFDDSPDDD